MHVQYTISDTEMEDNFYYPQYKLNEIKYHTILAHDELLISFQTARDTLHKKAPSQEGAFITLGIRNNNLMRMRKKQLSTK